MCVDNRIEMMMTAKVSTASSQVHPVIHFLSRGYFGRCTVIIMIYHTRRRDRRNNCKKHPYYLKINVVGSWG